MKTRMFRADWLIAVLGIALVGGGYSLMKAYLRYEEQTRSGEELTAIMDRLREDCDLSQIMAQAQSSACAVAARNMDELLRAHFASDSRRFASADPAALATVETVGKFIDRRRSEGRPMAGDGTASGSGHQVAEQSIFARTLVSE